MRSDLRLGPRLRSRPPRQAVGNPCWFSQDWPMPEFSWPDRSQVPTSDAVDRSRPATVSALPLGSHVSGRVIGRQPFGVFRLFDGVPNAVGLAEITAMPHHMELPAVGAAVAGEVIWHLEHNRQVKINRTRPRTFIAASMDRALPRVFVMDCHGRSEVLAELRTSSWRTASRSCFLWCPYCCALAWRARSSAWWPPPGLRPSATVPSVWSAT